MMPLRSFDLSKACLAVFVSAGLMLAPAVALPQSGGGQSQAPSADQFTEKQVDAFAAAAVQVSRIATKWDQRISKADNAKEAQSLKQKARSEIVSAIQQEGLDVRTYTRIYQVAQADPEFASRIRKRMREKSK